VIQITRTTRNANIHFGPDIARSYETKFGAFALRQTRANTWPWRYLLINASVYISCDLLKVAF